MSDIELRSYQQIAGAMIAKFLAEADLTDLSPGSFWTTNIEAAASSDFLIEGKVLQLLNLKNPDKATGADLEALAIELGLSSGRIGAFSSRVKLKITETSFTKISSAVFAGAVSPAAGDTALKIIDASLFPASAGIYIGRGTSGSEYITYTSKVNNGAYWTLNLSSALTKDHLVNEEVVYAQGGDRFIGSGTVVRVPAGSGTQAIEFATTQSVVLLDGEDTLSNIDATATTPGAQGNVGLHKITEFVSLPWSTASVTNEIPATSGRDAETDPELRQRIKVHVHNLARGTQRSIVSAVIGVSDSEENKRVVSAFPKEPISGSQIGILYIDDGSGFQPSFAGIGEEIIVTSAAGTEQFLQLQQSPLVKAQAVSIGTEPFALNGGERFLFDVDGVAEDKAVPGDKYRTLGVVSAQEVAEAINRTFTSVEARAKDGHLFVSPTADDPDYLRIGSTTNDANLILRFPDRKHYTLRLYKNDVLLEKNGQEAVIQTFSNSAWPPFGASETLQLKIDGILSPLVTVTDLDFATLTSSVTINGATASDWAIVLNSKFIGVTVLDKDDGTFTITSNKGRSASASVEAVAGSLIGKLFENGTSSFGKVSEYKLNRILGQLELTNRLSSGDELKAGTVNTAGFVDTLKQGTFDLSLVLGSPAKLVIVTEASANIIAVAQDVSLLSFTSPSSGIQRITGIAAQFSLVKADDWVHLYNLPANGLFRVKGVATNGSYVDLFSPNPIVGSDTPDALTKQIIFFRSQGMPQEVSLPSGVAVANTAVASAIATALSGGTAEVLDNDAVRIKTLRLDGSGALAIPVLCGKASNLGLIPETHESNDPHIAALESGDLAGLPSGKHLVSVSDNTAPFDTYQVTGTPFTTDKYNNRPLIHYVGATSRYIRQPQIKTSTSLLTLRDEKPFQSVGLGTDLRSATTAGLEIGEADNMVFIVDDNAANKTFDIPMYLDAVVASPSVPTSTQFDIVDGASDNYGTSTRWLNYRLKDYRVWFKARNNLPFSVANTEIRVRANNFGPNGKNILAGIFYPNQPSTSAQASFSIDDLNSDILINAFLASGSERAIGMAASLPVFLTVSGPVLGFYNYKFQFVSPINLSSVLVGDILSAQSPFNAANKAAMQITSITNLSDSARLYQHLPESFSNTTVTGSTTVDVPLAPTQTAEAGDKITISSISKISTSLTASTVVVPSGGNFAAGGGSFTLAGNPYTYTSYAAGTFSGVSPNPTILNSPGDTLVQAITPISKIITTINTPTQYVVGGGGFPDGDGYDAVLTHAAITVDAAPSFVAAIGDKIQVSSQLLTITSIVSSTIFHVDNTFTFTGNQNGTISRLILNAKRAVNGVTENITSTSAQTVRVFPLASTTATDIINALNNTAGVNSLITASNATGSNGSGILASSTEEELADGNLRVRLKNGESFVYDCVNANPCLTLKVPTELTVEVGEAIRMIPMTPENVKDHFSKKQISGLSIAAQIELVNEARHVQVASKIPGGVGQVYAVGGTASGNNVLAIRDTGVEVSAGIAEVIVDRSSLNFLAPGQTIKLYQTGRAKKHYVGSTPTNLTTAEIQTVSPGIAKLIFGVPLAAVFSYTHTGTVKWVVRQISRGRARFEILEGTASLPGTIKMDDWVLVGNGDSYAGTTPVQFFATVNQGYFQIRETDAATYFDVDLECSEQFVDANSAPFVFINYHSAMIGDQLSIANESPFSLNNEGTFKIVAIPSLTEVHFENDLASNEGPLALGSLGVDSIRVLDQGFSTYRTVECVSPSVTDPTEKGIIIVSPGYNISALNEGQGAKVGLPNRLGFSSIPVPGMSGYQYWTGLKRTAQRVLNGYEPDILNFEGYVAAGVSIEAKEPQIQRVSLNIKVKTKEGVSLASISDTIKSNVIGFINGLKLGDDVVLSEIVKIVQDVSGVDAVVLVSPTLDTERVTIGDKAVPRTSTNEITLS